MDACREHFRFDGFELQPRERLLLAHGVAMFIPPRAFDVLVSLVLHAGNLVSKDELLASVWPGVIVEEANLHVHICTLRKILGRDAIETEAGRGYRFVRQVSQCAVRRSPVARNGNLPAARDTYVEPPGQVATCVRLLQTTRLLTLTGVAGIGKSRLMREAAAACAGDYRDGVWLVDVASVDSPERLPEAIAAAFGVVATGDDLTDALARHVETRDMLLLLDNCEHLVQACAELAKRLLLASARLRIMTTCREMLRIVGESMFAASPLPIPPPESPQTPEAMLRVAAVRLFVDRALAEDPDFALTATNADAVAQICRLVDGIPLAIEFVARLVRRMTLQEIVERLRAGPDWDMDGAADDARHRSVHSALDASFLLLSDRERIVLLRLSEFTGDCTLAAAQDVCADSDITADDVLDSITDLVGKSFVSFQPEGRRYSMLATVRRFLQQRLADGPARDLALDAGAIPPR